MMEKTHNLNWAHPEKDFEDLFESNSFEEIIQLSAKNMEMLRDLYQSGIEDEIEKSVRFGSTMLAYFEHLFEREAKEQSILSAGKLMGYLDFLDHLRYAREREQMMREREKYCGTKHLPEIVRLLETYGYLSHSEIAEKLGLQKSTLSEALKKIRRTGFIQETAYGKYKRYSLTEEGIEYGLSLRRARQKTPTEQLSALLEAFLSEDGGLAKMCSELTEKDKNVCAQFVKEYREIEQQQETLSKLAEIQALFQAGNLQKTEGTDAAPYPLGKNSFADADNSNSRNYGLYDPAA